MMRLGAAYLCCNSPEVWTRSLKLVFLRIPKTGSTSLHTVLSSLFDPEDICPERHRGLEKYSQSQLENYRYFAGHFSTAEIDLIPGDKYVFTIMRDPAERLLSLYYFWKSHSDDFIRRHNLPGPRLARELSLSWFLRARTSPPRNSTVNAMTCCLAGSVFPDETGGYALRVGQKRRNLSRYEVLRRALNQLTRFDLIGHVGNLDSALGAICEALSLPSPGSVPRLRARGQLQPGFVPVVEEEITEEVREALANCTDLDRILYEFAMARAR